MKFDIANLLDNPVKTSNENCNSCSFLMTRLMKECSSYSEMNFFP